MTGTARRCGPSISLRLRQVGMSVQDEFGAVLADHRLEQPDPVKPFLRCRRAAHRRVVDQDHAEKAGIARRGREAGRGPWPAFGRRCPTP